MPESQAKLRYCNCVFWVGFCPGDRQAQAGLLGCITGSRQRSLVSWASIALGRRRSTRHPSYRQHSHPGQIPDSSMEHSFVGEGRASQSRDIQGTTGDRPSPGLWRHCCWTTWGSTLTSFRQVAECQAGTVTDTGSHQRTPEDLESAHQGASLNNIRAKSSQLHKEQIHSIIFILFTFFFFSCFSFPILFFILFIINHFSLLLLILHLFFSYFHLLSFFFSFRFSFLV